MPVIREGLWARYEALFQAFGWDVVIVKHGSLQEAAFKEPGGEALRAWINNCPNQLYSALTFQGGAAWRKRLTNDLGDQGPVSRLIDKRSDEDLARLMGNLGGHDLPSLIEAFDKAATNDRPTCFICYTIKGSGLALAGHKDNHAGMMTPAQMETLRETMSIRAGREWDKFEGLKTPANELQGFLDRVPFATKQQRRHVAPRVEVPSELAIAIQPTMSTQFGFGALLNELGRGDSDFVKRIVTTSPDVTVSTNLGPWVNRRNLFAREKMADTFKSERIAVDLQLGIRTDRPAHRARHRGEQPVHRALRARPVAFDQRRAAVPDRHAVLIRSSRAASMRSTTPATRKRASSWSRRRRASRSAGEGGAHQSIGTPLIGMAQDGLAAFEPAFVDELAAILAWSFDYIQKGGDAEPSERNWLRDETGGSVYLRLSTRPVEQIKRAMSPELRQGIIDGAYWMRKPGPNCQVVVAYTGAVAPEAIEAVGLMGEDRRDVGLLAVTSADRLNAGWSAAQRARERGLVNARSHIERLMADMPPHCGIVTVCDAHPATLGWLGAIHGHRTRALGVEHFGQTGSIPDLYRHYGIDTNAIVAGAEAIAPGRPIRYLKALP
jgi:pyruvate dehydrogenase E1 component